MSHLHFFPTTSNKQQNINHWCKTYSTVRARECSKYSTVNIFYTCIIQWMTVVLAAMRNRKVQNTWNMAAESNLKPSDPGCLTRDKADGSSTASMALKLTSPNTCAWVSGWALSWSGVLDRGEKAAFFFMCDHWICIYLHTKRMITSQTNSQESWICRAMRGSQPGSQTQTWSGCTLVHIHRLQCRGTPSLCCRRKSLPGSARGPPSLDHRLYHLKKRKKRWILNVMVTGT